MPYLTSFDGTQLYYKDWGKGRPVVLIHGWPLDADQWEYQAPALASAGHRVIAYDRRGFGRSEQPWTGYTYDALAGDLKAVIESLDLQDAALVGFSMAGGEIARYMSRHGGAHVRKVVMVSCITPFMLKTEDNPAGVDKSVFDGMIAGLEKDRAHFLAGFSKTFFGLGLLSSPVSAELVQWMGNVALRGSPRATIECVKAFGKTDLRGDMGAFNVPTLVIHGDSDQTVPLDASGKRTAAMIQGAELKVYAGAPHALPFTHHEQLNQDLIAFLG